MRIVHNALELSEGEEDDKSMVFPLSEFITGVVNEPPIVIQAPEVEASLPVQIQVKEVPKATPVPRAGRIHCDVCGEMCSKPEDQEIHKDHHATRKMDKFLCLYCMGWYSILFIISTYKNKQFNQFTSKSVINYLESYRIE
jgi:hypothetical protein